MAPSSLASQVADAGYTPGVRDLPALLALFREEDDDIAKNASRAVMRIDRRHLSRIMASIITETLAASRPARGRLTRLVGTLAALGDEKANAAATPFLRDALADGDPKTRRAAARALGKLPMSGENEDALLAAWDRTTSEDDRRPIAEALGKIGSLAARERLSEAHTTSGALATVAARAEVMISRAAARGGAGSIDLEASTATRTPIVFHCREGLESIVAGELGAVWKPEILGPGAVGGELEGPLSRALAIRTAMHVGFALDAVRIDGGDIAKTLVRSLIGPQATAIFKTFTAPRGAPARFRVAWKDGGHRRALTWQLATLLRGATSELVNDPKAATWEVVVGEDGPWLSVELVPRGFRDERFAWRKDLVSASSHPTIAAAIARVSPRRDDDVVWDPFVGAGAELVERARLGKYALLVGSDLQKSALGATRQNLERAGVKDAELVVGDALTFEPSRPPTVILSNPPMGRRMERGTHAKLLQSFVERAKQVLTPGGALVWIVPEPEKMRVRAARAGFILDQAWAVDMGGFPAELGLYLSRSKR